MAFISVSIWERKYEIVVWSLVSGGIGLIREGTPVYFSYFQSEMK